MTRLEWSTQVLDFFLDRSTNGKAKQEGHPRRDGPECRNDNGMHGATQWLEIANFDSRNELGGRLFVGGDGAGFVVVDVEHGVKLGELQNVFDLAGQVEQFESGALILGCGVGANEFAQAR